MSGDVAGTDGGFSVVEVLAALVILAMLGSGLGSLVGFGATLHERTAQADEIAATLLKLDSLRETLAVSAGKAGDIAIEPADHGLVLSSGGQRPRTIRLRLDGGWIGYDYSGPGGANAFTVDLSAFEGASIEYLAGSDAGLRWSAAPGERPLGTRLLLKEGGRRWSILLWVVPRPAYPA